MKYIELFGNNIREDIGIIKDAIDESPDIVFVYSGNTALYDYINALYDNNRGLNSAYLYKFKVCYEKKELKLTYFNGKQGKTITCMSGLVKELDSKANCRIVVESNNRVDLAFIVQQLIFIEYPVEKVDILLRKEEKDASKTKRFMKNVNKLMLNCNTAITRLEELKSRVEGEDENPSKEDRLKDINDTLSSCQLIKEQIEKSLDVELKFAVAASKKAGKSVLVNCFLGEEIAPTSTELATPNNCIYKRSIDSKYHLQLEGEAQQDFDQRADIFDVINSHFRNAQNNKEKGFSLPDMHIGYVTDENNFSSYTIYDTAGPDAAGTNHKVAAMNAMQLCDVAVFAIDYSKYLTDSEERYLKEIKDKFSSQNKFHSLIFALNKIDVRYNDVSSPKSFIKSVDFIRTRLAKIAEEYKDCIIFPTCSLEYFNAIEAEKAGVAELNSENNLPIGEMKKVKFTHMDVPALAWLHTHSENLEYYHGIQNISYDVFKKDSGMPALMSYVSYVAQSKARDEIVNNITFKISSQKAKMRGILDNIKNIEALINASDEKISEITRIITDYTDSVKDVLKSDFSDDDLSVLNENDLLKSNSYEELIEKQKDSCKTSCKNAAEKIYTTSVDYIWRKISNLTDFDGNDIERIFSSEDLKRISNEVATMKAEETAGEVFAQLQELKGEIEAVAKHRQEFLRRKSSECREQLKKENIILELPQMPEFEFAATMPSPGEAIVNVGTVNLHLYNKLSGLFSKKFWSNIGTWLKSLFGGASEKDYKLNFNADYNTFYSHCEENLKSEIKNAVYENNIVEEIRNSVCDCVVDKYMESLINEIKNVFSDMNKTYKSCVENFESAIDDRDKYKADIAQHNLRKANIQAIEECSDEFMQIWNTIVQDFDSNETRADDSTIATV